MVKAKRTNKATYLRLFLSMLAVAMLIMSLIVLSLLLVAAIACGIAAYLVSYYTNLEYEYTYVDRELTIDRIASRAKRKRIAVYTLDRMEIFAPIKSYHLDGYKNRQVKTLDYSVGEQLQPDLRYSLYYEGNVRLILSPSEDLIKVMKNAAPRKVYTD
ncbi:MAG: hypothetical protein LBM60_07085 [Clostridium sp.]|jgi:hypothetical protein|nr:hypothetical protein [Clostridium sp.]